MNLCNNSSGLVFGTGRDRRRTFDNITGRLVRANWFWVMETYSRSSKRFWWWWISPEGYFISSRSRDNVNLRESDRLAWLVDCDVVVTWSQISFESLWELIRFISITSDFDSSSCISLIWKPLFLFRHYKYNRKTNRFLSARRIKSRRSYRSCPHQWIRC